MGRKIKRFQSDLTERAYERLTAIKALAGAQTHAEVIRAALEVYMWCLEQKIAGNAIRVVANDGSVTEVVLFS